ncbi:MAG: YjfB family protein [Lachnospiraceae bacterium]|nr:YjfB family protein [Candidatus Colinaster scatohippi]
MDIASVSMALANIQTQNDVSTAVLSKALDQNEIQGQGILKMIDSAAMERSVNPSVGSNFDMHI